MTTAQIRRRFEERYGPLPSFTGGVGNTLGLGGVVVYMPDAEKETDARALATDVAVIGADFELVIGEVRDEQEVQTQPSGESAALAAGKRR